MICRGLLCSPSCDAHDVDFSTVLAVLGLWVNTLLPDWWSVVIIARVLTFGPYIWSLVKQAIKSQMRVKGAVRNLRTKVRDGSLGAACAVHHSHGD